MRTTYRFAYLLTKGTLSRRHHPEPDEDVDTWTEDRRHRAWLVDSFNGNVAWARLAWEQYQRSQRDEQEGQDDAR